MGRCVKTTAFVDPSHAGDKSIMKSVAGYILFVNKSPVIWYSKRQNTVESSTFSSEFIAMKTCVEHTTALSFKLMMFGIPINMPSDIFCDNESVVKNYCKIESVLNKKPSSIAYHATKWTL